MTDEEVAIKVLKEKGWVTFDPQKPLSLARQVSRLERRYAAAMDLLGSITATFQIPENRVRIENMVAKLLPIADGWAARLKEIEAMP